MVVMRAASSLSSEAVKGKLCSISSWPAAITKVSPNRNMSKDCAKRWEPAALQTLLNSNSHQLQFTWPMAKDGGRFRPAAFGGNQSRGGSRTGLIASPLGICYLGIATSLTNGTSLNTCSWRLAPSCPKRFLKIQIFSDHSSISNITKWHTTYFHVPMLRTAV